MQTPSNKNQTCDPSINSSQSKENTNSNKAEALSTSKDDQQEIDQQEISILKEKIKIDEQEE